MAIAEDLMGLWRTGRQVETLPVPDMAAAGKVIAGVRRLREADGARVVGRKIGFSNRTIWPVYGVDGPLWNYVWDETLHPAPDATATVDLAGFPEPRIEPEIVFRLARTPEPGMDETALLACINGVAHGFEIVQSIFPGWKLTAPAAAAAFGLHGALVVGPWSSANAPSPLTVEQIADFSATLLRNGNPVETGHARNVLDSPLSALRSLVDTLSEENAPPLQAGELVTTGTLTDAKPIAPGEVWSAAFDGLPVKAVTVTFG